MRWPLKRLIVAGVLLGALAFAIWEAATATVRDVIVETAYAYPYGIREGRTGALPVFLSFLADGSRGQANDGGIRRRLSPH